MTLYQYLKIERYKMRGSFIKYTFLIPLALSFLMITADLYLRKESILMAYSSVVKDGFVSVVIENHLVLIWPIILMLTIVILGMSIFYIDQKNGVLTYVFSNPICKVKYLIAKLLMLFSLVALVVAGENAFLILISNVFEVSEGIDISFCAEYCWFQLVLSMGAMALQCFIFVMVEDAMNAAVINIIGICTSVMALQMPGMSAYIPYLQLRNALPMSEPEVIRASLAGSVSWAILLIALSFVIINKREIRGNV